MCVCFKLFYFIEYIAIGGLAGLEDDHVSWVEEYLYSDGVLTGTSASLPVLDRSTG